MISTRKPVSRPTVVMSSCASTLRPAERFVRIVISKIAIRSSTIRMPNTMCVNSPLIRCSSNALTMIVVEEIEIAAPAYRLCSQVQPNACPATYPSHIKQAALHHRHEADGRPDFHQLLQAEFDAEREHQQNDAQLRQRLHDVHVRTQRDRHMRPHDQPGQQIPQHHRLPQPLKHDRRHRRRAQHDRQRLQKFIRMVHSQNSAARGEAGIMPQNNAEGPVECLIRWHPRPAARRIAV